MKLDSVHLRPTALWLIFGPVLICMWIAAVNYMNNLVYAILYLIASLSFVSLFHTWRNLASVRVEHIRVQPAFAGEEVRVEIFLRNLSRQSLYGLHFSRVGDEAGLTRRPTPLRNVQGGGVRIGPDDTCTTEVAFTSGTRGVYKFEALLVRTAYPFGLFWASIRVPVDAEYYVYPQAKGTSTWPALMPGGDSNVALSNRPGDDFAGVRPYMAGESLRHVDWKAFARGRPLSVKQFSGGGGHELWLDAADMNRLPLEARLSQLALWIVNAEKAEIPYALKLGRTMLPLGLGAGQSRRALETLAVAGMGSS
jgi:uncharacterized protein (DUF58 family)